MLGVLIKIWNTAQKDQIYLSIFIDISAGVVGEYRTLLLSVMIKIWTHDQKDQIYFVRFLDILTGEAGEYRVFVGNRFDPYSLF